MLVLQENNEYVSFNFTDVSTSGFTLTCDFKDEEAVIYYAIVEEPIDVDRWCGADDLFPKRDQIISGHGAILVAHLKRTGSLTRCTIRMEVNLVLGMKYAIFSFVKIGLKPNAKRARLPYHSFTGT